MIFIIEGPDGSGKSTLAGLLSSQTGYPVIHRSQPKTEEEKARMYKEYEELAASSKSCILDRCWYSEMTYGPVMRDKSVISVFEMYRLESLLTKHGAMIIYCTGKPNVLWSRCLKRGEEYITSKENYMQIYNNYEELMNIPHKIPVVRYEINY